MQQKRKFREARRLSHGGKMTMYHPNSKILWKPSSTKRIKAAPNRALDRAHHQVASIGPCRKLLRSNQALAYRNSKKNLVLFLQLKLDPLRVDLKSMSRESACKRKFKPPCRCSRNVTRLTSNRSKCKTFQIASCNVSKRMRRLRSNCASLLRVAAPMLL